MESRGDAMSTGSSRRRFAIPRRSCDQCRCRKVGCDRGSPCSNCVSSKLTCTFGTVASKGSIAPKQRVLISAEYERKIDDIAEGLEEVKTLLQRSHLSVAGNTAEYLGPRIPNSVVDINSSKLREVSVTVSASKEPAKWDHSAQVNDFVRIVTEDRASRENPGTNGASTTNAESDVLGSLRRLARALDESNVTRDLSFPEVKEAGLQQRQHHDSFSMPPTDAIVLVLRWAKGHTAFFRIEAVSRILSIEKFTETCQKVCFAVDEYSQCDFIIANGYLSYIFSEYITATGKNEHRPYYTLCRQNAQAALSRLPLLLPATVEAVAALTFGVSYAIESSRATLAWAYISKAADLCQTLGLHRLPDHPGQDIDNSAHEARIGLFWMVFLLDKSLSLRLGRPSNLRDAEVTTPLPSNPHIRRCAQTSQIQGRIYDQLYGPTGLAGFDVERGAAAQALATELREFINETKAACRNTPLPAVGSERDEMRPVYFKIELVKQLSLLTLILRAVPAPPGSSTTITDECAAAAYETLDMHQQCMATVKDSQADQLMTNRYLNWGILHTPFVPFSVLFTRAVQLSDGTDLPYLDRFSESLRPGESPAESITHPYRLYKLLCQAARLYTGQDALPIPSEVDIDVVDPWSVFDFAAFENGTNAGVDGPRREGQVSQGLSHWFYGSQQLMNLLDDDVMF